jgi:hydrogenase-4 component F
MSEFLVISSTFARMPLLAVPLVAALLVGIGALFWRLHGFAFGQPKGSHVPVEASYLPTAGHLGLVLLAGIYLPPLPACRAPALAGLQKQLAVQFHPLGPAA